MKYDVVVCCGMLFSGLGAMWAATAAAQEGLITRATPTGTMVGYQDTPLMPWTDHRYHVHDPDRPVPRTVLPRPVGSPAPESPAPSDAIVLFDGSSVDQWKPSSWLVDEGVLVAGEDSLETRDAYGDVQLHVEWSAPTSPPNHFMNRGNSGVILMGLYEIQIFDSWHEHPEQIYPDGQAAAIYGQTPPRVNACLPPGQWQSFDIVFTAPVFEDGEFEDGELVRPPRVTMYHNGVLVHLEQEIYGEMAHREIVACRPHPAKLPLVIQGHGSPVRFRNIWLRPLEAE
jgi:hypothetical protein